MTSFMNKVDLLTYEEVRDILDEIKNQLFHLERSQKELLEAMDECPGDDDFAEAYRENIEVIEKKKDTYNQLLDHLETLDPSFRRDQYENANRLNQTNHQPSSTSSGPIQLDDSENEEETTQTPPIDANPSEDTNTAELSTTEGVYI